MSDRRRIPGRPHRSRVCLAVLLLLLLAGAVGAEPSATHFVRLPTAGAGLLAELEIVPLLAIDYGSFRWLELTTPDLARLASSGVPYTSAPDGGVVRVPGFRFDPLGAGEPNLASAEPAETTGLRLVQFVGPPKREWLAALEATGQRVLQYYPHHSYLTWAASSEQVSALDAGAVARWVRWHGAFHPAYKISQGLSQRLGMIDAVEVLFYDDRRSHGMPFTVTVEALRGVGASVRQIYPAQPDRAFYSAIVGIDAGALDEIARIPTVLWLGYQSPRPVFDDEMASQIVAGNHPGGVPVPGYLPFLSDLGFDGTGVIWSITDSGVDLDHPDLDVVGGISYPGCPGGDGSDPPFGGHGTHVAGIFGGDGTGGFTDDDGFLYGVGVAPGASIFAQSALCVFQDSWPPVGGWPELSKQGLLGGAVGSNNSWAAGIGLSRGYQSIERTYDFMARDGNFETPGVAEPYILVFSAGNSGPAPATLTSPKEAKNLISVGATRNFRDGMDIDALSTSSSRGPAADGRFAPSVVAPGQAISSTRNDLGGFACADPIAGTDDLYAFCSGTSMASPHVSGALAVITQWWRDSNDGADPSPAMARALVVNGAEDISGAPPIPNHDEGWGRVHLQGVIAPSIDHVYRDQVDRLESTGQELEFTVMVGDPSLPLRVTVAWTDAPAAAGADPTLVNDLDLRVTNGGVTYLGNAFSGGWSSPGGEPDVLNNLENVFLETPAAGTATITVGAARLAADGVPWSGGITDQDFALVCSNCTEVPDFTLDVVPVDVELCAPADAEIAVEVGAVLGFSTPVTLSTAGVPPGTQATWSVNPVTPGNGTLLTVSDTGAAPPGDYALQITGTGGGRSHDQTVALTIADAVPGAASPIAPPDGATDQATSPTLSWSAAGQADSYVVEVAADPGFTSIVYSASVTGLEHRVAANLGSERQLWWRVRAENACGAGGPSTVFGLTTRSVPPVLLVDDDDDAPDVRPFYVAALDALGVEFDVWNTSNSDAEPAPFDLDPYEVAVWFTGGAFDAAAGPGTDGEASLADFLDAGGCLLVSSNEMLFVRGLTSFFAEYLGLDSFAQDVGHETVTGTGPVFGGLGPYDLLPMTPIFNFSDRVVPSAAAELAFEGSDGDAAILRDGGVYRTVLFGFALEGLAEDGNRQDVLSAALDFCADLKPLFADGFESGDLSRWSAVVGAR